MHPPFPLDQMDQPIPFTVPCALDEQCCVPPVSAGPEQLTIGVLVDVVPPVLGAPPVAGIVLPPLDTIPLVLVVPPD